MTTIKDTIVLEDIGLHTGVSCKVALHPYDNEGIFFKFNNEIVKALAECVCDTSRCTMLKLNDHIVQTCEHLLSVIYALDINSILIEPFSDEIPIFDGSGKKWFEILKNNIVGEKVKKTTIKEPIEVVDGDAFIKAYPSDKFEIEYHLDYANSQIGKSEFVYSPDKFEEFIAPSRTFALYEEVEFLRANGLAKGGSEENCIVVFNDHISCDLIHNKEFNTHKILDLLGDLSLVGKSLNLKIVANKSGHKLNNIFARKLKCVLKENTMLDAQQIKEILPHRSPFLFVDRVTEVVEGKSIKGFKNISMNEYFFQGHFPGHPILPGVIICEAMAQLGGILLLSEEDQHGKLAFFAALDQVRFKRPVVPGDRLDMEVDVISYRHSIAKVNGKAYVDGELACEGVITCKIMDKVQNKG